MAKLPISSPETAISETVRQFDVRSIPRIALLNIASVADEAPAWPSLSRDQYLDRFWPNEPFLAGAIFSVASRNAAFRWELTGPRRQVQWAQKLLSQVEFGKGWQTFIMKISQDLLTQGNGAWIEIIRPARARMKSGVWYDAIKTVHPETHQMEWFAYDRHRGEVGFQSDHGFKVADSPLDLPIGLAHIDTQRVERTGDPAVPGIYTDIWRKRHPLAMHQVVPLSEMPSPREEYFGQQRCAVDRALRVSQIIRDMQIYKHEKISGRFARAIHLTNIDADVIEDAVKQANENNDNSGLIRYTQPIIAATLDPNARASTETIELASLPDGFDEESTLRWYVAALALDLGVDYGFLAPLPGNKLGTGTQAETADRQARGKSSRLFINLIEHAINWQGILPCETTFRFNTPDPFEESERDRAFARRARSLSILIKAGVITPEIAAQIASDDGDLSPQYLAQLGIADLTPIITVSANDTVCETRTFTPRVVPQVTEPVDAAPEEENA
jgi:hypothetical protein